MKQDMIVILDLGSHENTVVARAVRASYVVMFTISSILGAKYYPIPYRWGRLAGIFVIMGIVYGISLLVDQTFFQNAIGGHLLAKLGAHTILISGYLFGAWKLIRK